MNKLTKSQSDQLFSGVCGGIADFFGISAIAVRLIFVITCPVSFWVYVILVITLD